LRLGKGEGAGGTGGGFFGLGGPVCEGGAGSTAAQEISFCFEGFGGGRGEEALRREFPGGLTVFRLFLGRRLSEISLGWGLWQFRSLLEP
jgi:hypothetical protein